MEKLEAERLARLPQFWRCFVTGLSVVKVALIDAPLDAVRTYRGVVRDGWDLVMARLDLAREIAHEKEAETSTS
ncbi:MAG: hypothetical protein AAFM92_03345 [Pseudomonadota bacterium]